MSTILRLQLISPAEPMLYRSTSLPPAFLLYDFVAAAATARFPKKARDASSKYAHAYWQAITCARPVSLAVPLHFFSFCVSCEFITSFEYSHVSLTFSHHENSSTSKSKVAPPRISGGQPLREGEGGRAGVGGRERGREGRRGERGHELSSEYQRIPRFRTLFRFPPHLHQLPIHNIHQPTDVGADAGIQMWILKQVLVQVQMRMRIQILTHRRSRTLRSIAGCKSHLSSLSQFPYPNL